MSRGSIDENTFGIFRASTDYCFEESIEFGEGGFVGVEVNAADVELHAIFSSSRDHDSRAGLSGIKDSICCDFFFVFFSVAKIFRRL